MAELRDVGLSKTFPQHDRDTTSAGRLLRRATDSLVVDHLQCNNYNYTLSIFQPECGLSTETVKWQEILTYQGMIVML